MNKIVVKLLIEILELLMEIREGQTGSRYSWTKQEELINEARNLSK